MGKKTTWSLTTTQLAALGLAMKHNGGITCAFLGDELWGQWSSRHYGNCSCPYARPAGKVLAALVELGLVERTPEEHHITFRATPAGERTYKKNPVLREWKGGGR